MQLARRASIATFSSCLRATRVSSHRGFSTAFEEGRLGELANAPSEAVILSSSRGKVASLGSVYPFVDTADVGRYRGERRSAHERIADEASAASVGPAVVPIVAEYDDNEHSFGSGVVVEHFLLTCEHVVEAVVLKADRRVRSPLRHLFVGKGGSPFVSSEVPSTSKAGRYVIYPPEAVVFRAGTTQVPLHGYADQTSRLDFAVVDLRTAGSAAFWPAPVPAASLRLSEAVHVAGEHTARVLGFPSQARMSEINYQHAKEFMNIGVRGKALKYHELETLFAHFSCRVLTAGCFGWAPYAAGPDAGHAQLRPNADAAADEVEPLTGVDAEALPSTQLWPHLAPTLMGMSGGPVVSADGKVVALHSGRSDVSHRWNRVSNVAVPLCHPVIAAALHELLRL